MDISGMSPGGPHELPFNRPTTVAGSAPLEPQSQPQGSPPAKRRRTASAALSNCCRTCRLRKVKCTGNPGNGACSNCARLELSCPFATASDTAPLEKISRVKPSSSHTEAGTLRKRAQRACSQCHAQKTKCSGDLPRCKRCEAGGLNCEYTAARRKFANVRFDPQSTDDGASAATPAVATTTPSTTAASPPPKPEPSASLNPSVNNATGNFPLAIDTSILTSQELLTRKNFILKHLDAYFERIYWLPCMGFFHPETAYRQVYEGNFDPPTAAAVCAISSFFVAPGESSKEFALKCSDEIDFYIFRNIHKFTERALLPFAINLCFNFLNGSFAKVWQCFGIASRLQQELLRRIAWQFFVMDRLLAGGYEEYISCRAENMKIRLPCREDAFWEDKPVVAERLSDKNGKSQGIGLHGLTIRIIDLKHRIQAWTKTLASGALLEPSKVMEDINTFQKELTRFHLSIPDDIRLSDQSIAKYIASPERSGYVFLHTHLSVGHIELYRFALPGILDPKKNNLLRRLPQDFVKRAKKQAVAHALCTGRFCVAIQKEAERLAKAGKPCLAGDATIPHLVTESLRVFLIAMQHRMYENLTEDTTAPLWRFQPPDESYIRSLIEDGLLKVSAPWSPILVKCQQSHTNNLAMYADFKKTRKFAEKRRTASLAGPKATGHAARLPGPHYILENSNHGVVEQEERTRATDAAAADRWFRGPDQANEPSPYTPPEADFESEYGPPGVPLLLAVARVADQPELQQNMFDLEKESTALMSERMWLSGGMGGAVDGQYLTVVGDGSTDGTSSLPMLSADHSMMFEPPPQDPNGASVNGPPPSQFMAPQPGMYMNSYAPPYSDAGGPSSGGYMQQAGFG